MRTTLNRSSRTMGLKRHTHHPHTKRFGFLDTVEYPSRQFTGVRKFCKTYAMTQDTFTRLAGFSPRAVANWSQGRTPSASTTRRLTEIKRLFEALEKLVKPEAIGHWLKEPNPAFDGSTPLQVIERGEMDRLWGMIHELESGEPG